MVTQGSTHGLSARGHDHTIKPTDLPALLGRIHGSRKQMVENQMSCAVVICCSCCAVGPTFNWEAEGLGGSSSAFGGWWSVRGFEHGSCVPDYPFALKCVQKFSEMAYAEIW